MKNATPLFEAVTELGFFVPLDWSRQSCQPKLADLDESDRRPVSACSEAEQFGLFAVCPIRHVMLYRGVAARHAGTGHWRVDWLDGSSDSIYLGDLLRPSILMFRGLVDCRAQRFPDSALPEVPPALSGESRAGEGFSLSLVMPSESGKNQLETSDPSWRADDNFQDARQSA